MFEKSVLLVCDDSRRAEGLSVDILTNLGGFPLRVATSTEVLDLGAMGGVAVVLIDLSTVVGVGALLGLCEDRSVSVPVVALDESYDEAVALSLFGQGITEYLSISDHLERFGAVIEAIHRERGAFRESGPVEENTGVLSHT